MHDRIRRRAFTLIELLTVMAIIVILIGILTPALSAARNRATTTAIKAQINAMSVGLDSFVADEGEYPPSNAIMYADDKANPNQWLLAWEVGTTNNDINQGAHIVLDALVGRDLLGYDPRAPLVGPSGTQQNYDRWAPYNDRRQPYIPVDGIDITSLSQPPEDQAGVIPGVTQPERSGPNEGFAPPGQTPGEPLVCRVFRDKFGWPILYYQASPTATQNSPIIQTANNTNVGDGVYDGRDNFMFTSYTGATNPHKINDADQFLTAANSTNVEALPNRFAEFIRSIRSTTYDRANPLLIRIPRPVKSDRFIILSAGRDGIYGNLDDVANFEVLSTER